MDNPSTESVAAPSPSNDNQSAEAKSAAPGPSNGSKSAATDSGWTGAEASSAQWTPTFEQAQKDAAELLGKAKAQLQPVAQWARQMIKAHPVLALSAGVGVLFVAARRRRNRK